MTYEEALDWCEQFTNNLVAVNVETNKRTLGLQAMQKCKEAIKKQIPQKPFFYKCPKCDSDDISCMDLMDFGEIKRKHCPDCGQALDWSK